MLNETYYRAIWEKYKNVHTLPIIHDQKCLSLTLRIILQQWRIKQPIHFNFQNSERLIFNIAQQLFIELANDIYLNHYDLPSKYEVGERLKRISDNEYYQIIKAENNNFTLKQAPRKSKNETLLTIIPNISYDKLCTGFLKIDSGISEITIKNYFNYFKQLNNVTSDFLKIYFDRKSIFIAKKTFWDDVAIKSKIPSIYLPNPREESDHHETKSIQGLPDYMIYFTPKYELCYNKLKTLFQAKKIHTVVAYDTEANAIPQIIQDKNRFGFNLIILSNAINPIKNSHIPCWNWFKEEIEIVNSL